MYGLPDDFDAQLFLGRELTFVTFATNVISLRFGEDLLVTVESSLRYRPSRTGQVRVDKAPVSDTGLVALLGQTIASASVESKHELRVRFGNGGFISFLDDSEMYESFRIMYGAIEIIV